MVLAEMYEKDTDEFLDIIDKAENERFGEEEKKTDKLLSELAMKRVNQSAAE